jgi:hypothetical protein
MKQLDQFSAQLSDFGTQPQPMYEAPQGIASISADVSSFLPGMPGTDSRPTMMTAPPVLGAAPTADGIDFDASANPSVTSVSSVSNPHDDDTTMPLTLAQKRCPSGSKLFKKKQQEVDAFNSMQAEQTAYETARDTAPLSDDPNDPTNVYLGDSSAAARAKILQDAGIKFSDAPPATSTIPPGGVGRLVEGSAVQR